MKDIEIKSRVDLVPISEEDTDLIVKWRNSPSVQNNFIFREPFTKEMHEGWLKNKVATGKVIQFMIVERESGRKIGSTYLRDIDKLYKSAEYGIFIGEDDVRGKGFGTEAAVKIVQYGFNRLHLHRIFLRVFEKNLQAINSYLHAGFLIEGVARDMVFLEGEFHNILFMSQINQDDYCFEEMI